MSSTHTLARSHDADGGRRRYYVDGVRVPFARFFAIDQRAQHQCAFRTLRRGSRLLHSKVATIISGSF